MADNYCQFSSQLKFYSEEAANSLENLLRNPATLGPDYDEYDPPCAIEREDPRTLWVYSMDYFDEGLFTSLLAYWAKQFPDEDGLITYSYSCSKPRVDAFGGNVIAFSGGKIKFFSPWPYAQEWIKKHKKERIREEEETTE